MVADYCPLDGIAVRNPCRHSEWANSGPGVRRTENERRRSSRVPVRSTGTKCEGGRSHRGEEAGPIPLPSGGQVIAGNFSSEEMNRSHLPPDRIAWDDHSDSCPGRVACLWSRAGCRVTALPSPAESGPWTAKNDRRKGEREDWCDFCFLNFYKSLYDPNW